MVDSFETGLIMGAMRFRYLFDSKKVLDAELSSGVFTDATPLKESEEIISDKNSSNLEQVETKIEAVLSKIGPLYEKNLSTIKLLACCCTFVRFVRNGYRYD